MPELPEVETLVRDLRAHGLEGSTIRSVEVLWPRSVAGLAPDAFARALRGRTIARVERRAKYIVVAFDSGQRLLLHLRMTGKLRFDAPGDPAAAHDRVRLTLEDRRLLVFNDARKFGRFRLCRADEDPLAALGPEPLEAGFTAAALRARLAGHSRRLKPLLLDQTCVAGLGNIYVDEALWESRLHPLRRANSLSADEIRRLRDAIRTVLRRAVANSGTTLGDGEANFYSVAGRRGRNADALRVFRRDGQPCPRCGTTLIRSVVGQRGTHTCPACQPQP